MSTEGDGVKVTTTGGRHGAVADTIHGGVHNNYYHVPPDATPEEKADIALKYLESGQATTARRLLSEVIVHLDDDPRIWYHWLLAFFSGRTLRELSAEDRECLRSARVQIAALERDTPWSRAIQVIFRLVDVTLALSDKTDAIDGALADLDRLDERERRDVLRHLERVVQGPLKDRVWHRDLEEANDHRVIGGRRTRVWKFFEPEPAKPRARPVRPAAATAGIRALAGTVTVMALAALVCLAWLGLERNDTSALVAVLVCLGAAGVALVNGADWRFRIERRRVRTRELRALRLAAPPRGFAGKVDHLYARYATLYAPPEADRPAWYADIEGPISRLRDELVEVYRESRIPAGRVKWLIRFQVRELRREWDDGTLADLRRRSDVPAQVQGAVAVGVLVSFAGLVWAVQSAVRQDVLLALGAFVGAVVTGWAAAELGVRIMAENRRVEVETVERTARLTTYWFEFQRWQQQLVDRPTDMEMAQWLDCDRRILLQETIRAYKLRWSDISAYASLEARGAGSERARAENGPWRYSRYKLLVFLLTPDGVRQITVDLDFGRASFHEWQRTNYRYDAVAAARVTVRDDGAREFQLFLVNGVAIGLAVTEAAQAVVGEDNGILAEGAQDTTGLRNTLFVLEGVAAEGRSWWNRSASQPAS
jgi:hypothetical protein